MGHKDGGARERRPGKDLLDNHGVGAQCSDHVEESALQFGEAFGQLRRAARRKNAAFNQAEFAADGIDELIMGFGQRRKYQPGTSQPGTAADGGRLRVLAADTGDAWSIEVHESRLQPRRDTAEDERDAGCTLTGSASGIYLYLWNRADAARAGVTITGDPALLASWQASVRVRWS